MDRGAGSARCHPGEIEDDGQGSDDREGFATLEAELKQRQQVERPRIIQAIAEARAHGDLSENAEYHAAKEAQAHNEGRIAELEDLLSRAEIIDVSKLSGDTVKFGATVTLIDEDTERRGSLPDRRRAGGRRAKGQVSITSPIARALIGKTMGDTVEVKTPGGGKSYEIVGVLFALTAAHAGSRGRGARRTMTADALAEHNAWVLTDGKAGDEGQCLGITDALGLRRRSGASRRARPSLWLMPGARSTRARRRARREPDRPPFPDLLVASGRRAVPMCAPSSAPRAGAPSRSS